MSAWGTLQSYAGNQAAGRRLQSGAFRPNLAVNRPGDRHEVEADRAADSVMASEHGKVAAGTITSRQANYAVQRKCDECQKEEEEMSLQRKEAPSGGFDLGADPGKLVPGDGRPLTPAEKDFFERRFGYDFGRVRIHDGADAARSARGAGARAFTLRQHIVFGSGQYSLQSASGKWLMAHELTHVIQQESASPKPQGRSCCGGGHSQNHELLRHLGPGRPLQGELRYRMESAVGAGLSSVRLHADANAGRECNRLGAAAFSLGEHVAIRPDLYQPGTPLGQALLAHELAHAADHLQYPASQRFGMTPAVSASDLGPARGRSKGALAGSWAQRLWGRSRRAVLSLYEDARPRLRASWQLSFAICDGDKTPAPTASAPAAESCDDICNRAYRDPALNGGGGGVVCSGTKKCPCVFDLPGAGITRGECPLMDAVILAHEQRHVSEGECPGTEGLSRLGPSDPSTLIPTECVHRRESIEEMNDAIRNSGEPCKSKMQVVQDGLRRWVAANCGA
jgi:hypothetical protein